MNRGVLGRLIAVVAIALCCVVALPAAAYAEDVPEDKTEFHITNRNDFLACVALSRQRTRRSGASISITISFLTMMI